MVYVTISHPNLQGYHTPPPLSTLCHQDAGQISLLVQLFWVTKAESSRVPIDGQISLVSYQQPKEQLKGNV